MPRRNRPTIVHPPALRELQVLRVTDVTPALRRVTLTGEQLGAFSPTPGVDLVPFVSSGFDDDINMIFPYPGESEPVLPVYRDGKLFPAKDRRPLGRHYTVRRYDPNTRELDVDFVRHGVGVAATWAYRAQPGDVMHIGGPSASLGLPDGFDWLFVVADATAVPAVARLLEELPDDARAQVILEVAEPAHRQQLRELPGVDVTWVYREGAEDGSSPLLEAVHAASWWDGDVFAWVAGEQSLVRDARRHLVEVRDVPKAQIEFVGYWKRTPVVASAADPSLPDPEAKEDPGFEKFHEQSELLPALAIRLAVGLGLGDLISRGVTTTAELAARTGTVESALRKFLRYLQTIELVVTDGDTHRLTDSGEVLTDDWMTRMLDPKGVTAQLEQGLFGLGESLRTGRSSLAHVTGRSYADLRADPTFERAHLDEEADGADYLAAPIAAHAQLVGIRHLRTHSDIPGALAAALTESHAELRVTVVANPAQAAWLAEDLDRAIDDPQRRSRVAVVDLSAELGDADAVLLVNELKRHPDAEAARLLAQTIEALPTGGRVLLFEEAMDPDDVDDHDAEADLLNLTLHGSGYRTDAEIEAIIATAGLRVAASNPIVWTDRLRTLVRTP